MGLVALGDLSPARTAFFIPPGCFKPPAADWRKGWDWSPWATCLRLELRMLIPAFGLYPWAYSGQNSTPWNTLAFVGLRDWIDQTLKWSQIAEVIAGNGYVERITLEYPVVGPMPPKAFVSLKIRPFVQ